MYDLVLQNDINTIGHTQCKNAYHSRVLFPSAEYAERHGELVQHSEPR